MLKLELNLFTTDSLGQKKVAVVERFKQESMYGQSPQKSDRCREVVVSGGSTVLGSEAWGNKTKEMYSLKPWSQVDLLIFRHR